MACGRVWPQAGDHLGGTPANRAAGAKPVTQSLLRNVLAHRRFTRRHCQTSAPRTSTGASESPTNAAEHRAAQPGRLNIAVPRQSPIWSWTGPCSGNAPQVALRRTAPQLPSTLLLRVELGSRSCLCCPPHELRSKDSCVARLLWSATRPFPGGVVADGGYWTAGGGGHEHAGLHHRRVANG